MIPLLLEGEAARAARRAIYSVALADGELEPRELEFIESFAGLEGNGAPGEPLAPIAPLEVARVITDPLLRRALVQRLVLVALLDEVASDAEGAVLREFCTALAVDDPSVEQFELIARGHFRCLGFDLMRRGFIRDKLAKEWKDKGFRGLWAIARAGAGDPSIAARYAALGDMAEGTLGRAIFAYYRENEFALPGEKGGPPEAVLFHDLGHVLSGHATDPRGEVQMVGFEAGYMRETGFSVVILALVIFHLGVNMPGTTATPARGAFELATFHDAYARGQRLAVDLREWDFWTEVEAPLDALRARLGVALSEE